MSPSLVVLLPRKRAAAGIGINDVPITQSTLSNNNTTSIATMSPDGPKFIDNCQPPYGAFEAGKTYLIEVGNHFYWEDFDNFNAVDPVKISISGSLALRRPDLVVTNLSWAPTSPVAGSPIRFSATVKNQGTAPSPGGVPHGVLFKVDGTPVSFSDLWTASLSPGASVTLTANGGPASDVWPATPGTHTLTAIVDNPNRIANESSETNNARSAPLTVVAGAAKPDLVVTGVGWQPTAPAAGSAVTFTATVKNQGTASTLAGTPTKVGFMVDGVAKTWSDTYRTAIAAGQSAVLTANAGTAASTWAGTAGPRTIRATVDDGNRIVESNEANNIKDAQLTIGTLDSRPDLIVTSVSWSPTTTTAGTGIRLNATVKNQGTSSTPEGTSVGVLFRIAGTPLTFSDTWTTAIQPGTSVTVSANGGGSSGLWIPTVKGLTSISATVDNPNRIPNESNEGNNRLETYVNVS